MSNTIHATNYDPADVPAWEALRNEFCKIGLGGSDIGAAAGLPGAFSTPYALWAERSGLVERKKGNSDYLRDGRDLEALVAARFEEASGFKVRHRYAILQNDAYPHLFANIDRFVDSQDAGLEIKTYDVRSTKFDGGECPPSYIAQITVYLAVTGKKRWFLSAWAYGQGTKHYLFTLDPNDEKPDWCEAKVVIDPGEFDACEKIAADFIRRVRENDPPPVSGSDADETAIRAVHPVEQAGTTCDLGAVDGDLDRIAELDEQIDALEREKETHRQTVMQFLGDNERGESGKWKATFKTSTTRRLDGKAAKAALGSALDPYYTESSSRTLRLRKVG